MSILEDVTALLSGLDIPFETGHFSGVPPDAYVVVIPLVDTFDLAADNRPHVDVQEARLALYSKGNFVSMRDKIVKALLDADFTITDRRYIEFENDTQYHHTSVDVARYFILEED